MYSGQHRHSKRSSEKGDQQDQANDDADTGRSHRCVFCKQGFSTAQALGGHMNIHRRDRAKIIENEPPMVSTVPYSSAISSHPQPSAPEANRSYNMYFPPSSSNPRNRHAYHANDLHFQRPQPMNLSMEDYCGTDLSLQIGPRQIKQCEKEKKQKRGEDEVDLELRLGHDP